MAESKGVEPLGLYTRLFSKQMRFANERTLSNTGARSGILTHNRLVLRQAALTVGVHGQ